MEVSHPLHELAESDTVLLCLTETGWQGCRTSSDSYPFRPYGPVFVPPLVSQLFPDTSEFYFVFNS